MNAQNLFFHSPVLIWIRQNLFSSFANGLVTLIGAYFLFIGAQAVVDWLFISASWTGDSRDACVKQVQGACWPFVTAKIKPFIYGNYPDALLWRPNLVFLLGGLGLVWLVTPFSQPKKAVALFMLLAYPVLSVVLLSGGIFGFSFGLTHVPTNDWGGLLVTLIIAVSGIVLSLPLGILLALGRQSNMPVVKSASVVFIEVWRGVPLITVLFMASVMLPLFMPKGVNFDALLRCLIGVALFASAYMAEVIRGGLQAIPAGQYEACKSLGLSYWQSMYHIILPQALRISIPGIVNTFIGLFKDTTLVMIVGIFDLMGVVMFHYTDPNWAATQVPLTGYIFAGFVFWIFCFAMSRYSSFVEKSLSRDERNK